MGKTTDGLLTLAQQIAPTPEPRELDMLLATGEQVTIALLAMALHIARAQGPLVHRRAGRPAHRPRPHQGTHHPASPRIASALRWTPAGWRWSPASRAPATSEEITTLGRGGSDLTGVALAAALKADVCEIYTDVDGVYTADPNIVPDARKLRARVYDEMLEMASLGAKVLQTRSVEFAKKYGVPVHVRSTFKPDPGTLVTREESGMEEVGGLRRHARPQPGEDLAAARARSAGHRRAACSARSAPRTSWWT